METGPLQRLCRLQIQRLLVLIISLVVVLVVLAQLIAFPYKSYTLSLSPVTKGILVHEADIYDNASITHEGGLNESKVEGCKGFHCDHDSLLSQNVSEQNDSVQSDQKGQTISVALEPTRLSYMISVLESTVAAAQFNKDKSKSARDRQLQLARMQIENAPLLGNTEGLHAPLYRNVSRFL
ncbi:probable glycosyltransferase, partial [Tanacetum coccineum]